MAFIEEQCTRCGECFTQCKYMDISRQEAILEISRLIAGEPTRHVMQKCISCQSCNVFCPETANPYELILDRWAKRYSETGLPVRASYMMPYQTPNYREDMVGEMSAEEQELLSEWKNAPVEGEVLYPGCNLLTVPMLFRQKVLEALPVSGDWSLCCGEPYFRLGAFEVMEQIAEGLTRYYSDKKVSKMVFVCPACMNMFRNILPERFGAKFNFECQYFADWFLDKLDAGDIEINKPLEKEITIHDSCHGRVLGDEIMGRTRELYTRLGLKLIELKSHHEEGICCGIAAGCNRQMPQDIVKVGGRALKEGVGTGTDEMAIYCTGCYLHLGIVKHISRTDQKLVHTLEYIAHATSEEIPRVVEKRTRKMLGNILRKPILKMLSPKRFKVDSIKFGS